MKDRLTKEDRQLLSDKLMMNEQCDVVDFIEAIDNRLLMKREAYEKFLAQFENGFVNAKKLSKSLKEVEELCEMRTICITAYEQQKYDIGYLLLKEGFLLRDVHLEEKK